MVDKIIERESICKQNQPVRTVRNGSKSSRPSLQSHTIDFSVWGKDFTFCVLVATISKVIN